MAVTIWITALTAEGRAAHSSQINAYAKMPLRLSLSYRAMGYRITRTSDDVLSVVVNSARFCEPLFIDLLKKEIVKTYLEFKVIEGVDYEIQTAQD